MLTYDAIDNELCLYFSEDLDSGTAGDVERLLLQIPFGRTESTTINLSGLTSLDTTGAWLIQKAVNLAQLGEVDVRIEGARPEHTALIRHVADNYRSCDIVPSEQPVIIRVLTEVGENTVRILGLLGALLAFLSRLMGNLFISLRHPRLLRGRAIALQVEVIGTRSMFIVGLIAFLIGGASRPRLRLKSTKPPWPKSG